MLYSGYLPWQPPLSLIIIQNWSYEGGLEMSAFEACAFAAFSGVLFGMDQGNYNGASQFDSFFQTFCVEGGYGSLEQCRAPSNQKPTAWVNTEMFFAPVLQVGSAFSSLWMAPMIARQLGRRACIFWGAVISFWGMICIATSRNISVFILARVSFP